MTPSAASPLSSKASLTPRMHWALRGQHETAPQYHTPPLPLRWCDYLMLPTWSVSVWLPPPAVEKSLEATLNTEGNIPQVHSPWGWRKFLWSCLLVTRQPTYQALLSCLPSGLGQLLSSPKGLPAFKRAIWCNFDPITLRSGHYVPSVST